MKEPFSKGIIQIHLGNSYAKFFACGTAANDLRNKLLIKAVLQPIEGWDGPVPLCEGIWRYSKNISWIRLYIDVMGPDFFGGTCGYHKNFEIEKVDGQWHLFETELAQTQEGDLILRLRNCTTWEIVYERINKGTPIDAKIETTEDMARFLEKSINSS